MKSMNLKNETAYRGPDDQVDDDYLLYLLASHNNEEADSGFSIISTGLVADGQESDSSHVKNKESDSSPVVSGKQKRYRTRNGIKDLLDVPCNDKLALISQRGRYQYAISFYEGGAGYAHMILTDLDLNKMDCVDGDIFSKEDNQRVQIRAHLNPVGIKKQEVDIPFLVGIYSIMHECGYSGKMKFYIPDLKSFCGAKSKISTKKSYDQVCQKLACCNGLLGVLYDEWDGNYKEKAYPVLLSSTDEDSNTVSIESPYFEQIIKRIPRESTMKDTKGRKIKKKDGSPKLKSSHSYLVNSSIVSDRCKAAVINVFLIVTLIEQAGDGEPHIKAGKLIKRNAQLKEELDSLKTNSERNTTLKRVFTKTWELLRTATRLKATYSDIEIPNEMPKVSTMDGMVLRFPHKGKKEDKQDDTAEDAKLSETNESRPHGTESRSGGTESRPHGTESRSNGTRTQGEAP